MTRGDHRGPRVPIGYAGAAVLVAENGPAEHHAAAVVGTTYATGRALLIGMASIGGRLDRVTRHPAKPRVLGPATRIATIARTAARNT